MSGSNNGNESWTSRLMKVASAAAATAAVAGGLYAILSSSTSARSDQQVTYGAQRENKQHDEGEHLFLGQAKSATMVGWKKPEIGWVKLNVDGSLDPYKSGTAGCGGVLRDASGKWLSGFAKKLNPNLKVHQTELHGILMGLKMASEMNVKKLIVESDNDSVVRMIENGIRPNQSDYNVVEQIRTDSRRFDWEVRFVSISNKANCVADRLANDARKLAFDDALEEYLQPPSNCEELLLKDEIGCFSF